MSGAHTIPVNLPRASYDIHIGAGLLDRLGELIGARIDARRALLIVDEEIEQTHGAVALHALQEAGFQVSVESIVAEEQCKTLATVRRLYDDLLAAGLDRTCPVVALGGGVIGDVAGFAAATYLRGVPVVQVPTTLLAMVDAAIGGKTGVNIELPVESDDAESPLGKNLIGAFWQPALVVADPLTLHTLPDRELRCGLAECIKHAVIADAALLAFIEDRLDSILAGDDEVRVELIHRSAQIKVSIVVEDEREAGRRALMNLGHTFAHVIETIEAQELKHGEAVSIGICAAARCARETGWMSKGDASRIESLLERAGLPVRMKHSGNVERLMETMRYDKKTLGGALRLVLPRGIGDAEVVSDVDEQVIRRAWGHVGAAAS